MHVAVVGASQVVRDPHHVPGGYGTETAVALSLVKVLVTTICV